jgi:hypothetical protein
VCQLAAKRVYGGRPGSGTRYTADKIRETNECLRRALDFKTHEHLSFQSAADLLNAGCIDAAFFNIRDGANLVLNVEPRDIVAMELEPFLKDVELSDLPCRAQYGNSKLPIKTMCSKALLLASKNLPSHLVYRLLRGLYDEEFYKKFGLLTKEESHKQSSDFETIPLHEAAERFYKGRAKPFDPRWTVAVVTVFSGLPLTGIGLLIIRRLSFKGRRVFIGHGHSTEWLKLHDFLRDRIGVSVDEFNRVSAAGKNTTQRLKEMLNASQMAFLVVTGEDFHADGLRYPRQNVVHEIGLFQGGIGFHRAIILLEQGCERFTNIEGLTFISFPSGAIEHAFEEVRKVLEREGLA